MTIETEPPSVRILGSRVHMIGMSDLTARMDAWITSYEPGEACRRIVVTGFHGIWEAHQHPEFKAILNSADLWIPDGIAPVWVARRKGFRDAQRTPGAEVMQAFFDLATERGYSSYFYGDTDETLANLKEKLDTRYAGHRIVGTYSPPFRALTPEEHDEDLRRINDARPDVLWVGLGLPKQDRWIFEHRDKLKVPLVIGVGAAFGFLSGKVKRVPAWIGRHGLEWAWRLVQEPKKLWRRDLLDGPRFMAHVALEWTGLRKYE